MRFAKKVFHELGTKQKFEFVGGELESSAKVRKGSEPVFLNVYGAQELTPRNEFHQPM
jgi:hypothetical protein